MATQLRVSFVMVVVLAGFAAGCGGDSADSSTVDAGTTSPAGSNGGSSEGKTSSEARKVTSSSLSKTAFVKEASAICKRGGLKAVTYQPPQGKGISEAEVIRESIKVAIVPAFRAIVDEIYELGAPSGEEEQVQAYLDAFTQATDTIEARQQSIGSYKPIEEALRRSSQMARGLGLEQCVYVE